jgi:predicted kinase
MLIAVSGGPGSGKSTLAIRLARRLKCQHYEADMFMINEDGFYEFDPESLNDAHQWCQNMVRLQLEQGHDVIVANTFTKRWELAPYVGMAFEYNVDYEIHICHADYGNVHDVPDWKVRQMINRRDDIETLPEGRIIHHGR